MNPPTLDLLPELPPLPKMLRAEEIHPGDVIAGKYRVRAILGRSHGLLVEAFHTEFDQRAIIKLLLAGSGDEREIERFRREARVLAKLESEHVARIIDVGTESDGSFYLVRQYLDGIDLATYVQQNGPLALVDAILVILQIAEAVAETHSHGIILRELQPGHLFLTQRAGGSPLIRISDFGTAKLMRDAAAPGAGGELTATAMFGLSPYSSPELLRKARDVDARADVWSLGAILYELLTGRPPFHGEAAFLMLQITREEPPPPSQLRPDVPPEIDQIIAWALAKDVDARFKNVHAFAHALLPYASPEGQLLVERIAQIASQGKRRGGSAPPPAFPSARSLSAAPPAQPATLPPPPMTPQIAPAPQIAAAPHMPPSPYAAPYEAPHIGSASPHSAPRSSRGRMQEDSITDVRVAGSAPPSSGGAEARRLPAPPPGQPMGTVPAPMQADAHRTSSAPTAAPPVSTTPASATTGPGPATTGRKAALAIIAASAVLVPVLVILLVLKRSSPSPAEVPGAGTQAIPAVTASATPTEEPAPSATAAEAAAPASASATTQPAPSATAADTAAPDTKAKPARTVAPAPAPAPAPAGPATGTLLAVAVGGSCAFSVNGASKGSGSSIKLSLKPGTYSVVCKGASGSKSKSVTVRSGETAMAAFKL